MQTSDSNTLAKGIVTPSGSSSEELAAAMASAIAVGDKRVIEGLVQTAEIKYPDEPLLVGILARCRDVLRRDEWLTEVLEAMQLELDDDHFAAAVGHFREALCLSHGFPALKAKADEEAVRQLPALLPRNWRVAEVLLREAGTTEPFFSPDASLHEQLEAARYEELIISAIHKVDRAEFGGSIDDARVRLKELLQKYPREKRLADRLDALSRARKLSSNVARENTKASPGKGDAGASLALYNIPNALIAAKVKRAEELISQSSWNAIRNFATLAGISAMLAAGGFLIWQHLSTGAATGPVASASRKHPQTPPAASTMPVVAVDNMPTPDERAWQVVKTSDDAIVLRAFVSAFPASPHAYRAKMKLAAMEWGAVDKTNADKVRTYLRLHSRTPYRAQAEQVLQDLNGSASIDAPPVDPIKKQAILEVVRAYLAAQPRATPQASAYVIDEPLVDRDQASVQLHPPVGRDSPSFTLSLVKSATGWKVQSVQ